MYEILDKVNSPADLKKLNNRELVLLCGEIRRFLIENITKTGGHLASNLGVVELTVALNLVYDFPKDKIIWDVGHQSYVHKILTGRRDGFSGLRKFGGMSGFPKTSESEYDCFNTGHASTSVSAALGMARARDLKNEDYNVTAVFGDGAMTGGLIYEALNDAGHRGTPLVLILNDNEMSISKNVGALSKYLRKLRQAPGYHKSKRRVERFLDTLPVLGKPVKKVITVFKDMLRKYVIPSNFFDDLGMIYLGPIDGHNVSALVSVLKLAKGMDRPVLVHVITKKGYGYAPAEINPQKYHGIAPSGFAHKKQTKYKDYSECAGKTLVRLAQNNENLTAITAAMPSGVGLTEFSEKYPKRFFDVGIAEEHAVTLASGMSIAGMTPVFAVYSSFLQRSYDQILHDMCLQKLHVVLLVDRAGIVGADGETHHGLYDIEFLSNMPYMTVLSPSCFKELEQMLEYAVNVCKGPVAIRYPRGNGEADDIGDFEIGKFNITGKVTGNVIVATGRTLINAKEAAKLLEEKNIEVCIVSLPTISPLPEGLGEVLKKAKKIVTAEDHSLNGGIGTQIGALLAQDNYSGEFCRIAFPNEPIVHGTVEELDKKYGLDPESIAKCFFN